MKNVATTNRLSQLLCAWSAVATMVFMFLGLWLAGFLPDAIKPALTADQVAALYRDNTLGIRIGGILVVGAAGLYLAFTAGLSAQMRRIENTIAPVLSYAQLAAGTATSFLFLIPGMFWTIAAFRPERSPELTQALSDVAFLFFLMPYSIAALQDLVVGIAILSDKRESPVFPRWVGYWSLWVAIGFMPAGLAGSFKSGPFAWNGLFVWWIPLFIFSVWLISLTIYLIKAINRQASEEGQSQSNGDS